VTRHRLEVLAAFVGGVLLTLAIAAPVDGGVHNCKPARKCATPSPGSTVIGTSSPTAAPTVTPTSSPGPTSAPTVSPTSSARPFPAPVTTSTVSVPASIDSSGATDAYRALNDWLTTVPNGSVVNFPTGGTFRLSQGVKLGGRSNLVLHGNGSAFLLTGAGSDYQASGFVLGWSHTQARWVGGSAHIAIDGFSIVGNDPTPGTLGGGENQMGLDVHSGSSFVEISNVTVRAVYGDGIFSIATDDAWYHDLDVQSAGRNGVSIISGHRVLTEASSFTRVGYATFDIEPNFATEASSDITFRGNVAGTWQSGIGFVSVDGGGRGADIRRVTIAGNRATGMPLQIYVDNRDGVNGNAGATMFAITVTGNHGPAGGSLRFAHIDGLVVADNDGSYSFVDVVNRSGP
jgi:hypothetical protein